jgi:hypothetical protein
MIRFALPFCIGLSLAPAAYADWRDAAKECGNAAAAQARCASCSALWPEISACAAKAEGLDHERTAACIARVNNENWAKPMYFDRVAAVFACLAK